MKRLSLSLMMLLSLVACAASGAQAADIRGRWLTASGNVEVEIKPCPTGLCGYVAKVLGNVSMEATTSQMKAAPAAVGLEILSDLTPAGDHWRGHIYNRESGKTYDCQVRLTADGKLEVHPYVGVPVVGKTQYWTRV